MGDEAEPVADFTGPSATAILASAKTLFLEDGYDGVNLERLARHAGVSRQTLYNQFGSKEAVFRAMIRWHWSFLNTTDTVVAAELDPAADPEVTLRRIAAVVLDFLATTDQIAFTRLVIGESRRWPWIGEEFYRLGKQPALDAFAEQLNNMHRAGTIDCPDALVAAHQFLGLIQEFVIWPHVMGIGRNGLRAIPGTQTVIDQAVATFLARYAAQR